VQLGTQAGFSTMTAQILAAELGTLIQDAKRKNTELRNAAEKSLQDLKALPNTSEAQLAAGKRPPHKDDAELTLSKTYHGVHISSLHF
jgi:hypothetical protein